MKKNIIWIIVFLILISFVYLKLKTEPILLPILEKNISKSIVKPFGELKVAVIEFVYKKNPKVNFYYEFYCNKEDCIFRTPEQDTEFFIDWCGKNCNIIKKSFFSVLNNPRRITNIYPIGKSEAKYSYSSIYELEEFYENEAKRYNVDLNINLDIIGPYILLIIPPQRSWDEDVIKLEEFFDNETKKKNIDLSKYDIINYVYLTDEKYFVDTISGKKTFSQIDISFDNFIIDITTISHEMGHVFGASDTYTFSWSSCKYPEGYPNPNKKPLYPQNKACLMCGSIMIKEKTSRRAHFSELVVCDKTAEDFGWI